MKKFSLYGACLLTICGITHQTHSALTTDKENVRPAAKNRTKNKAGFDAQRDIRFAYANEDLIDIINELAAKKDINVTFPMGTNAITAKVSLSFDDRLTLDEAWNMLVTILDVAGYSLIQKGNNYSIIKTDVLTSKEPLPLFVNSPLDQIPNSDQRIRYLYFLSNIKVSSSAEDSRTNELDAVLRELLSEDVGGKDAGKMLFDSATNAMILTDKANNIKAAMRIVLELDRSTFQERLELLKLKHTDANVVAQLFNEQIIKDNAGANPYRLDTKKRSEASYFSKNVKVVAEPRTNSLILLGRSQDIDRIKHFVENNIDVELDSGQSILHIYQLQYLDAQDLVPVLEAIVKNTKSSDQATGSAPKVATERDFEGVIIKSDKPADEKGEKADFTANIDSNAESFGKYTYPGGNKLIVAARQDDWRIIRELIEQLDKPQRQVILEIFIVDITLQDPENKAIQANTRIPKNIPFFKNMEFQSAQASQVLTDAGIDTKGNSTTLHPDLLKKAYGDTGTTVGTDFSIAHFSEAGSTVFSLGDQNGDIWSFIQMLQSSNNVKILSQPHIIAMDNQTASVEIGESRYVADAAVASVNTTQERKKIEASLKVTILPRISSATEVNLAIDIDIDAFDNSITAVTSSTDGNRNNRRVKTSVNMRSDNVIAFGGLIKTNITEVESKTPLLGDIPVLKWLFKRKSLQITKSNLVVFISPTIVEPRLRSGMSTYTQDYIDSAKKYAREGEIFESLRDPVTRWFFGTGQDFEQVVDNFTAKDETKHGQLYVEKSTSTPQRVAQQERMRPYNKKRKSKKDKRDLSAEEDLNNTMEHRINVGEEAPAAKKKITVEEFKETIPVAHRDNKENQTINDAVAQKNTAVCDTKEWYRKQLRQLVNEDEEPLTRQTLRT